MNIKKERAKAGPIFLLVLALLLAGAGLALTSYRGLISFGGRTYYWNHTHFEKDSWLGPEGAAFRTDEDGALYQGWYEDEGGRMYLVDGVPVTGNKSIDGRSYYFNSRGIMARGITLVHSVYYYYNEEGIKETGFIKDSGHTYYFSDNGMVTGWYTVDSARYYFDSMGFMATGRVVIDGAAYYFQEDGKMLMGGWIRDEDGYSYLMEDGKAATGRTRIDGEDYYFSKDGFLIRNRWVGNSFFGKNGQLAKDQSIDGLLVDQEGNKIFSSSYGDAGSLYIPSVGVEVPLYKTKGDQEGQDITDRQNSAAYFTSFSMPVIADHKNQGFDRIKNCLSGKTPAFILTEEKVTEYRCTDLISGRNTEYDIVDDQGKSIDESGADLCLYTCNEDWQHVTIVLFKRWK